MRFIVDAQLPNSLSMWLQTQGLEAIHTLDLPKGNRTDDAEIIRFADQENMIVITKDSDFLDDHIVKGSPKKLPVVKTGNIMNRHLILLFERNITILKELFTKHDLIEINGQSLIVHE